MRIRYKDKEVDLLARIMRAEAVGEGLFGMKLVGNVVVNRVAASCSPFKKITTLEQAIFQKNAFEGTKIPLFNGGATTKERKLAMECIRFWRAYPAYRAIYFQAPGKGNPCKQEFWGPFEGRFKNHCFYNSESECGL